MCMIDCNNYCIGVNIQGVRFPKMDSGWLYITQVSCLRSVYCIFKLLFVFLEFFEKCVMLI